VAKPILASKFWGTNKSNTSGEIGLNSREGKTAMWAGRFGYIAFSPRKNVDIKDCT
jgi:hypothetical protein